MKKLLLTLLILTSLVTSAESNTKTPAKDITTDVTQFNKNLSSADTDVQKALQTINDLTITGLPSGANTQVQINNNGVFGGGNMYSVGGNVGIGSTSPGKQLDVQGGDVRINGVGTGVVFQDGTKQTTAATSTPPAGSGTELQYRNGGSFGAVSGSVVDSNGNIGLGSSSPGQKIDIIGAVRASGGFLGNATTSTALASAPTNCNPGEAPTGVDNEGDSLNCTPYLESYTETDPIVRAINGLVKSNGSIISAATAGIDYVAPATTITAGTGLIGGGDLSISRTLSIGTTGVSAGTYTYSTLTVNAQGQLTSASSGSAPASSANPSASVGLSAVNGSSSNYMTSDSAPALSQAISPTWTGNHIFAPSSGNTTFTAGNVGVGSSNPGTKLDVTGTVRATAFIGDGSALSNLPNQGWTDSGTLIYTTTLTDNVGIGTVTTFGHLQVHTGTNDNLLVQDHTGLGTGVALSAINDSNGANVGLELRGNGVRTTAVSTGTIDFYTQATQFAATINKDGNVGIGVSLPSNVEVENKNMSIGTAFNTSNLFTVWGGNTGIGTYNASQLLEVGNQVMDVTSTNVGIGSPNPGQKLDVAGTLRTANFAMTTGAASGYIMTASGTTGIGTWAPANVAGAGGSSPQLQYNNSGSFAGVSGSGVTSSGNIGILTTLPGQRLSVLGNVGIGTVSQPYLTATFPGSLQVFDNQVTGPEAVGGIEFVSGLVSALAGIDVSSPFQNSIVVGHTGVQDFWAWQCFNVSSQAKVASVGMYLDVNYNSPTGGLTVQIRGSTGGTTGNPTSTIYQTTSGTATASTLNTYTFSSPPILIAGDYCIVAKTTNLLSGENGYQWKQALSDVYANGASGYTADGGSSWVTQTTRDDLFQVNFDQSYSPNGPQSGYKFYTDATNNFLGLARRSSTATWTGGDFTYKQSSGNVGIGTTQFNSKLNVGSNESIGASYVGVAAPVNGLIVQGNTGIGSSAPGTALDVFGSARILNSGHLTVEGVTSTGATGTGRLTFDNTPTFITPNVGAATGASLALSGNLGVGGAGVSTAYLYVSGAAIGGGGMVRLDSTGNNLIAMRQGTSSSADGLRLQSSSGTDLFFAGIEDSGLNYVIDKTFAGAPGILVDVNNNVAVGTTNTGNSPVRLFINGAGTSGRGMVELNSSDNAIINFRRGATSNNEGMLLQNTNSGTNLWFAGVESGNTGWGNSFVIDNNYVSGVTPPLTILTGGNVGIGTLIPAKQLDVGVGTVRASNIVVTTSATDGSIVCWCGDHSLGTCVTISGVTCTSCTCH